MTTALIDGDILVYRMAFAVQYTLYTHKDSGEYFKGIKKAKEWFCDTYCRGDKDILKRRWDLEDWETEEVLEPFSNCSFLIDNCIESIVKATDADEVKIFLSPSRNFRHDLATIREYKANRPPAPKYKDDARNYLTMWYGAEVPENIEADDALGMAQTTDTVICSIDKDLHQIPGKHYDIVKQEHYNIDIYEADCWFLTQVIAGDSTDNIQGIPGMGTVKASRLVDSFAGDHAGLLEEIRALYEDHYHDDAEKALEENARLVYILRRGDEVEGEQQWQSILKT